MGKKKTDSKDLQAQTNRGKQSVHISLEFCLEWYKVHRQGALIHLYRNTCNNTSSLVQKKNTNIIFLRPLKFNQTYLYPLRSYLIFEYYSYLNVWLYYIILVGIVNQSAPKRLQKSGIDKELCKRLGFTHANKRKKYK